MNVTITFRHMDASDAIKGYAEAKLTKLQKFLRQPMTARVTLSLDKLRHVAEARVASGGARHEAKETSKDMYASIDLVMAKLERQIRGSKGAQQAKKRRSGDTLRGGKKPEPVSSTVALPDEGSKKIAKKVAQGRPKSKAAGKSAARSAAKSAAKSTAKSTEASGSKTKLAGPRAVAEAARKGVTPSRRPPGARSSRPSPSSRPAGNPEGKSARAARRSR